MSTFAKKKMFTEGQWIFAAIFLVVFVVASVFVYRKDAALHKVVYKGSYKVLIGFIIFVLLLFVIKFTMKR